MPASLGRKRIDLALDALDLRAIAFAGGAHTPVDATQLLPTGCLPIHASQVLVQPIEDGLDQLRPLLGHIVRGVEDNVQLVLSQSLAGLEQAELG